MITNALRDQTVALINVYNFNEHIAILKRMLFMKRWKKTLENNFSWIQYTSVYLKIFIKFGGKRFLKRNRQTCLTELHTEVYPFLLSKNKGQADMEADDQRARPSSCGVQRDMTLSSGGTKARPPLHVKRSCPLKLWSRLTTISRICWRLVSCCNWLQWGMLHLFACWSQNLETNDTTPYQKFLKLPSAKNQASLKLLCFPVIIWNW